MRATQKLTPIGWVSSIGTSIFRKSLIAINIKIMEPTTTTTSLMRQGSFRCIGTMAKTCKGRRERQRDKTSLSHYCQLQQGT